MALIVVDGHSGYALRYGPTPQLKPVAAWYRSIVWRSEVYTWRRGRWRTMEKNGEVPCSQCGFIADSREASSVCRDTPQLRCTVQELDAFFRGGWGVVFVKIANTAPKCS